MEKKIYQELLEILSDFIWRRPTEIQLANNKIIYDVSNQHQVSPIIYYQCKTQSDLDSRFAVSYANQISIYVQRERLAKLIDDLLADIEHLYFKGPALAELYSTPMLRSMGDLDVLVHDKDFEAVNSLLINNGFVTIKSGEEATYKYNNLIIEIHTHLMHRDQGNFNYFKNVWSYVNNGKIDSNYLYIYLLAHLRSHLVASGVGIRQFMDLAILVMKSDLNWEWIKQELTSIDLIKFAQNTNQLIKKWFGIETPINQEIQDEFYDQATEYIMNFGVFGIHDNYNPLIKYEGNFGTSKGRLKFAFLLNNMFKNYGYMIRLPYCQYLKNRPYLLPIAWLHRLIYKICETVNKKSSKNSCFLANLETQNRIILFRQWGL